MRPKATQFHTGETSGRALMLPDPRTPRIEKGTKVVLPGGEVRLITATEFDTNEHGVTTGIKLLFSDRWTPRVG